MKTMPNRYWVLYAAICGLLSSAVMQSISYYFDYPELVSFTLPGAVYGVALYIVGILGHQISGSRLKHFNVFITLISGSAMAWYVAVKSAYYIPWGGEMGSLNQMMHSGLIGAFIISIFLLLCWSIKYHRWLFVMFLTITGGVEAIFGYGLLKHYGAFLHEEIKSILFFGGWQSSLLIAACLFIIISKIKREQAGNKINEI